MGPNLGAHELRGKALIMARVSRLAIVFAVLLAEVSGAARAGTTLVSIPTPRGVTQAFILIKPDNPVASVILFAGGNGALGPEERFIDEIIGKQLSCTQQR